MSSEALGRRLTIVIIAVLCISVVVFAAVYGQPTTDKGLGGGCEWDPDTWQVVCEPTATPTPTPVPPTATFTSVPPTEVPTKPPTAVPTDTPVPPTPTDTPTHTPTPTTTPRPTAPRPTGWIETVPAKILVGQSTLVTAGWRNISGTATIRIGNSSVLAASCASGGRSPTPPTILAAQERQTLYGCEVGQTTVRLFGGNRVLAIASVEVLPTPKITDHTQVAYRWLNIEWTGGHSLYGYSADWRPVGDADWRPLTTSGGPGDERFRLASSNSADVRGLTWNRLALRPTIELKIVGRVGDLVAESETYTLTRQRPVVSGHMPDHTVQYTTAVLPDSPLGTMIDDASSTASEWVAGYDYLWMCSTACDENTDRKVVTLKVADSGCDGNPACVTNPHPYRGTVLGSPELELDRLRDLLLLSVAAADAIDYAWTNDETEHGKTDDDGNKLLWVKAVVRHEFGHTFGLLDTPANTYVGLMDASNIISKKYPDAILTIQETDYRILEQLYKGHTPDQDW